MKKINGETNALVANGVYFLKSPFKLALGDHLRIADLLSRAMLAYYFSRYFKLLVTVGRGTIRQTCGVQHLPIFVNCLSFRSLHSVFVVPGYRYKTDQPDGELKGDHLRRR